MGTFRLRMVDSRVGRLFFLTLGVLIGSSKIFSDTGLYKTYSANISPHLSNGNGHSCNLEKDGFHPVYVYHGPGNPAEVLTTDFLEMNRKNYGSQVNQDTIVLAITEELATLEGSVTNSSSPFFVDLASNDALVISNTFRLEQAGWSGLCIEPNPVYWFRLAHRKCRIAGTIVGGGADGTLVDVSLDNAAFGGIVGESMDNKPGGDTPPEKRYTISVKSLFENFGVPPVIDYLSLDVEGAEELIFRDFPFDFYKIRILTVERPSVGMQAILRSNGYQFVTMLIYFGETLWIHDSVLDVIQMTTIREIIGLHHKAKRPKKGYMVYNMDIGELVENT